MEQYHHQQLQSYGNCHQYAYTTFLLKMQIFIRILMQICTKLRLFAMCIRILVQICTKLRTNYPLNDPLRREDLSPKKATGGSRWRDE